MKLVLAGGTGLLGRVLIRELGQQGHELVVLSRRPSADDHVVRWDGRSLGPWAREIDGADAVINLAGRSVNCRYNAANLKEMMDSRVLSTRAVGRAIEQAARPPRVWLQMSTATIYAHRFDAPNDEVTGRFGGEEPDAPRLWRASIEIAKAWEATLGEANTPRTRKVALRSAMVMAPDRGGTFDILLRLTRWCLGGPIAGGRQYVSWIHDRDFARAVQFLLARDDLAGPINVAGPVSATAGRLHGRAAGRLGRADWLARGAVDGRGRRVLPAHRDRADLEEPAGGPRAAPGRRLRVRLPGLAGGGQRSRGAVAPGRSTTMKLPVIQGVIRRRILVNFRVDPEVIQRQLPAPFRPKLLGDAAMAGVCLIRLEQLRPRLVPAALGLASENAAHRVAVTWIDGHGQTHEGVYIPRRDSDSPVNRLVGGRLFPGEHRPARFAVRDAERSIELSMRSDDGETAVYLRARPATRLPATSRFASLAEASSFFESGAVGFSPRRDGNQLDGLCLDTNAWRVEPLAVEDVSSSYFGDPARFPAGSVEFDCALIMRDIPHTWRNVPGPSTSVEGVTDQRL